MVFQIKVRDKRDKRDKSPFQVPHHPAWDGLIGCGKVAIGSGRHPSAAKAEFIAMHLRTA
jgi:hypothetical protein